MKIKKTLTTGVLSLGLVVGLAGFAGASSGSIGTTGADSENEIKHESSLELDFENDTDLHLMSRNEQKASSGEAEVEFNTTGGDARTGSASNANALSGTVEIVNSQSAEAYADMDTADASNTGTINNTGFNSENEVTFENKVEVDIDNDTDISIHTSNEQSAYSGDAEVHHNTTGGDAVTGNVTNTNTSSFTVRVTN